MSDTAGTPRRHVFTPKRNRRSKNKNQQSLPVHDDPFLSDSEPFEPIPKLQEPSITQQRQRRRRAKRSPLPSDPHVRVALYVALAHAGLALSLALLFGLVKILEKFWRPIQWAILCSVPLRELHRTLVSFWSHSLHLGLFDTIIAIPISALNATTSSLIDSHSVFLRILGYHSYTTRRRVGFSKLMQWLVSFGLFVMLYERIGIFSVPVFVIPCSIAYANGFGRLKIRKLTYISSRKFKSDSSCCVKISEYVTSALLNKLKTTVGIGLIMFILMASVSGLVFFSYKIAMEGENAVVSLKTHLDENNYTERIGLRKWMDENQVPKLIDIYATKFYETVLQNIDSLAAYYNVTEIVDAVKNYSVSPLKVYSSTFSSVPMHFQVRPLETIYGIPSRVRKGEWRVLYRHINCVFRELMSLITREDLIEKIKAILLQSVDISKRLIASSKMVLAGGANILFFVVVSIISGAAGILSFMYEIMVFMWLLYYLMTTDSGGVMDHVLGMLPVSKSIRIRCVQVLDHAVSSVLLAAVKIMFFHGCLTYLLFRFHRIHFLYTSTFLALLNAMLPITPFWLASIPAAVQLAMEARYIESVLLTVIHQILLEYGTIAIQDEITGQISYLTGLSILGGIALFTSAMEGAIMGPLLMTVVIALKNLYVEFVLGSSNENKSID